MQIPKSIPIILCLSFLFGSCGEYLHQPTTTLRARIGEETPTTKKLKQLPAPPEQIYAAVYKFRDQTGQYRPAENGANWSTAVTQGATNILIKALENSNWFIPVERENVSNLLNERKIIRNGRAQFDQSGKPNNQMLPPLLFAGLILEGGIISYDANIMTGGVGARYFGTGGSAKYRQDRVTVYLRAISTQNGRILKTVYTSKTILSKAVDGSLFRFVSYQKLLEAETGYTYNEPSELAVTEAIEKAVYMLIMEGIDDNLWSAGAVEKDSLDLFQDYIKERDEIAQVNDYGRTLKPRRGNFSIGLAGLATQYRGDFDGEIIKPGANLNFQFQVAPKWEIGTEFGFSKFSTVNYIDDYFNYINLYGIYRFNPFDKITPYIKSGIGVFVNTGENIIQFQGDQIGQAYYGGGLEYLLTDKLGLDVNFKYYHLFNDEGDFVTQGLYTDMYITGSLGLNYYFGKNNPTKTDINE